MNKFFRALTISFISIMMCMAMVVSANADESDPIPPPVIGTENEKKY